MSTREGIGRVLGEIADESGQGDRVRNWFRRPGYVPGHCSTSSRAAPYRIHSVPPGQQAAKARPGP
ncbi:hypothetical protein AB0B15_07655 [Streptomyces sp. NPDC045456]|uniref:hypothetical protein n=1 Tax=Streptomyces sp. NPDC045456 TaxID=3155254 RepID=UPI0033E8B8F8